MKKGSGSLDFSGDDSGEETSDGEPRRSDPSDDGRGDRADSQPEPTTNEPEPEPDEHEYPYFVRRSKVGDERDERIEIHLRSDVSDQESAFRNDLADALETGEVSKTDAREFALKHAFENPDAVAELMRDEGYEITD